MRFAVAVFATGLVALGLWLMAAGFMLTGATDPTGAAQIASKSRATAGPIALGLALLVGGGFFFMMLLRRR